MVNDFLMPAHRLAGIIVKTDGKEVAETKTPKIAEDVAERLNVEEDRREEDCWA
jgi:hypothetical protein